MLVTYVNNEGKLIKETIDTYIDIFVGSDGTILTANKPILLLFGRGESRWLVQNEDYQIFTSGETIKEAFQDFNDFLIYNYNAFIDEKNQNNTLKRFIELKQLYLDTLTLLK